MDLERLVEDRTRTPIRSEELGEFDRRFLLMSHGLTVSQRIASACLCNRASF